MAELYDAAAALRDGGRPNRPLDVDARFPTMDVW